MASPEAQKAKDRGNAAFKRGDYPVAIGHYSSAIIADRSDHTYPLNRAAAYLKLGKHEDAERDCSTVLRLKPGNVKALYRRAQARTELGKLSDAKEDLQQALKIEPSNDSVKTELARVTELLAKSKAPKKVPVQSTPTPPSSRAGTQPRKRRRIPIQVVEGELPPVPKSQPVASTSVDTLKPISTRRLQSKEIDTHTQPSDAPQPNEANSESPQPTVRGGIFRSSGTHTLFNAHTSAATRTENENVQSSTNKTDVSSKNDSALLPQLTSSPSLFDFTRVWNATNSTSDKWRLFSQLPPQYLPSFFKASLEAQFLMSVLGVFSQVLTTSGVEDGAIAARVKEYMIWIPKVQRFGMVVMFMDGNDRTLVRSILDRLGGVDGWTL